MWLFALCVVAFVSILYSTLALGISPMPSPTAVRRYFPQCIPAHFSGTIVDVGSGWGTVCSMLSRQFPEAHIIGVERSPIPWLVSKMRARANISIRYGDYRNELPAGDIYYSYLFPGGMRALQWRLPSGATLISYAFRLPGKEPLQTYMLGTLYPSPLYLYKL